MSGSCGFLRFPGFLVLHLGDADAVGVHCKTGGKQLLNGDGFAFVIAVVGDKMQDIVDSSAGAVALDKVKFTHRFLNGDKSAVIRQM